jgi:hypothetical protein
VSEQSEETQPTPQPPLVLVKGDATDEEVAALIAVVAAIPTTPAAPMRYAPSEWSAPIRHQRRPLHPVRGGWRLSGLPR